MSDTMKSEATVTVAPFGIGFRNIPVGEAKEKGLKMLNWIGSKAVDATAIAVGLSVMGVEVGLRYSANGAASVANTLTEVHGGYQKKVNETPYLCNSIKKVLDLRIKKGGE